MSSSYENAKTGWLAFVIFQNELADKRKDIQIFLEKAGYKPELYLLEIF